jgi:hypothetical protein
MSLSDFLRVLPITALMLCAQALPAQSAGGTGGTNAAAGFQANDDAKFLGGDTVSKANASATPTNDDVKFLSTDAVSKGDIRDISVTGPQADSPFFIERQEAKAAAAKAGREGLGMYVPKPPRPPAREQIKKFFQSFLGPKKKKSQDGGSHPLYLTVSPSEFSLAQISELDVTLKVANSAKKTIELLYPDNQRLEILTKDPSGNVIARWSQDRVFDHFEGFVAVNPDEFIVYSEKLATAGMKAGETYTIEVSLAGQQGYTTRTKVTPSP